MKSLEEYDKNNNRALLVGNLLGLCMKAEGEAKKSGFPFGKVEIAMKENGDYETFFYITRKSGRYKISVEFDDDDGGMIEV